MQKIILTTMKKIFFILFICSNILNAQTINDERANTPVPFTLADRDRLIKLEIKVEEMEKKFDYKINEMEKKNQERYEMTQKQFDIMQKQYDDLKTEIHWLIGLVIGLIGFIIWDRATLIKPIERRLKNVEEKITEFQKIDRNQIQQLIGALKELAKTDKSVADVLKQFNFL